MLKAAVLISRIAWIPALAAVWLPLIAHYYVAPAPVPADRIQAMKTSPDSDRLGKLAAFDTALALSLEDREIREAAAGILEGQLRLSRSGSASITIPFSPEDLTSLEPRLQLPFASMVVPMILIRAYELTNDQTYFVTARDALTHWAKHDRSTVLPSGYLWNDHALASRIYVLTAFWNVFRTHPDYDEDTASLIFDLVSRSLALLAKESLFTAASSHGVMQNLALLHGAAAFPELPDSGRYSRLAVERLHRQMQYFVSEEGAVLEHSAGYQHYAVRLLEDLVAYFAVIGKDVPADWKRKYEAAVAFMKQLHRPDGSFPTTGDTMRRHYSLPGASGPKQAISPSAPGRPPVAPEPEFVMMPTSGFAVSWHEGRDCGHADSPALSQLTATWSRFPSSVHKHADDLSVLVWADGREWITASGYWPYSSEYRKDAISWPGSNAPHFDDEGIRSDTLARITTYANERCLSFIEMRRDLADERTVHRQVLMTGTSFWVVIDSFDGLPGGRGRVVWTLDPELEATRIDEAQYLFRGRRFADELLLAVVSQPPAEMTAYRGSNRPFRGWTVVEGRPAEATSIAIDAPASDAVVFSVYELRTAGDGPGAPLQMKATWTSRDDWRLEMKSGGKGWAMQRQADTVTIEDSAASEHYPLRSVSREDIEKERGRIVDAFLATAAEYPKFLPLEKYRMRATYLVAALLALQGLFFALLNRIGSYGLLIVFRSVSIAGWAATTIWLAKWYLV